MEKLTWAVYLKKTNQKTTSVEMSPCKTHYVYIHPLTLFKGLKIITALKQSIMNSKKTDKIAPVPQLALTDPPSVRTASHFY